TKIVSGARIAVALHALLDGRDTPPSSARQYVAEVAGALSGLSNVRFGTVGGRYFAMDRDKRWERVELGYNALFGEAPYTAADAASAVASAYARGETDEFVKPTLIEGFAGIKDGDGLLMGNFRADRARQILTALLDPAFDGFKRKRIAKFAATLGMVE